MITFKKSIRKIHLCLGLASGIIILFLGITGCLLAFQREIENVTQDYRFVQPQEQDFLPPSTLQAIAMAELPNKEVHAIAYEGKDNAATIIFFGLEPEYYYNVYLNPYSGKLLKVKNMDRDFFRIVLMGHFYLWLPPNVGQPIVASATLIFVIMLISGIILWWPKNKGASKQRFTIKWSAKWRRKNYDLHNVLGFYASWVAIILGLTGLVWGFEWFANSVYGIAGGKNSLVYQEPVSDTTGKINLSQPAIDIVWEKMKAEYPTAEAIEVHPPVTDASPIAANANPDASTYWKADYIFYDQYTFEELPAKSIYGRMAKATMADKLLRMNYDVHTGAIIGIAGKILMFFASLIAASLPITGFYIWRGRNRKRKKAMKERVFESAMTATVKKSDNMPAM